MSDKLAKRILKLIEAEQWVEIEELLLNTEDEWVLEMVEQQIHRTEGPQWVNGILSSLCCQTRESTNIRLQVYQSVLRVVRVEVSGSQRNIGELVAVLMMQVDTFPTHILVTLVDQYVELVRSGQPLQGRWVDLMAKTITSVSHKEEVVVEGHKMAGEDYRYQVVKTLCDLSWSAETAISLMSVIKDMDLPKEELEDVIHKVERVLKKLDYQSVPPLVYQLVQVVRSKLPHRVLQVVINYFNKQDLKVGSSQGQDPSTNINSMDLVDDNNAIEHSKKIDLTEAKGTVILHLTYHAQYNPALVQDFLKHLRSSIWLTERLITPFNLALALSLTSVEKFQDKILESLKSCLLKFFREEEQSQHYQWLRDAWDSNCDVRSAFITTVENCSMGWDQVSQGLVQLACSLLESGGGPKGETYASQQAVRLAGLILPLIIKRQPHLIRTVVSQVSYFILSSSSPAQYIVILEKLVRAMPLALLDHRNVLRDALEFLEHLPLGAATHLLLAINPLIKMNMALKDALMIILRKMLFSRKIESRQIAVRGFLQFLKYFRVMGTLPSSQSSMSFSSSISAASVNVNVHSVFNSSTNEALCLELLGVLRRCFSQQQEVKCTLYRGLYEVCAANPHLVVSVMELLLQHSQTFMDLRPDALNPIQLKSVVQVKGESVILVEPLGDLLSALAACQAYYYNNRDLVAAANGENDDDDNITSVLNEICSLFKRLTEKLSGSDLGDMGINSNGDFSSGSAAGKKNLLSAKVMVAVFDSLLEYTFITGQQSRETVTTMLSLFKSQQKISNLITEKNQRPGKKGKGPKTKGRSQSKPTAPFKSNLSLRVTADILAATLAEEEGQDEGGTNNNIHRILGNNHGFQIYLLSVVEDNLSSFKGLTRLERETLLPPLKTIAKVLLEECIGCVGGPDCSDVREVARLRQSLNILATIMSIFCKHFKDKLEAVLKDILGKTEVSSPSVLLHKIVKRCQKMLLRILHHKERDSLLKDATTLVQMLNTVTHSMDHNRPELREVQEWVLQLCKDQNFDNPALTEALLRLLFQLSDQVKANHSMTSELARELHSKLGDHMEGTEVESSDKYSVVTEDSAPTVLAVTLAHLDTALVLVELAVNKMKASLSTAGDYDLKMVEHCVIIKFSAVISGVHEIIQSALPPGSLVDHTLTTVTKLYNALSSYVKFYLDMYRLHNNTQLSEKFEKLVKMSGDLVSGPVYPMITYIDTVQRRVSDMGKGTKKGTALTARAMKESRLIPSLIFAVEKYEKHLITLSRRSRINLMRGMKVSINRDFRIMPSALVEDMEGEDDDEENGEEAAVSENGDAVPSSPTSEREDNGNEDRSANSPPSSPPAASSSPKKYKMKNSSLNLAQKRKAMPQEGKGIGKSQHQASQAKKSKMSIKRK